MSGLFATWSRPSKHISILNNFVVFCSNSTELVETPRLSFWLRKHLNNLSWMIDVNFWKFSTALRKILGLSQMIVICKGFLSYFCRCHFVHDVRFIFFMRACFSLMKRPHNFFYSFCAKIKLKIKKVHADIYFYIYVWLRCTSVIALYIYKLTTPCCPMLNLEHKTKLEKGVKTGACFSKFNEAFLA